MSEYQYYEFQAIDRPLDEADREELRSISTRVRITATSFTNHYEWGDFKGNSFKLMTRWFDLHLYLANWGTRRLMIRLPKRLVDHARFADFLPDPDRAGVTDLVENLILDIYEAGEEHPEYQEWDDGSGWLAALAPLRTAMLSGDWRLPYLVWLMAVENGVLEDNELEPLPGIGPLSGGLEAFAGFFRIDPDLVQAAAETPAGATDSELSPEALRAVVAAIPESEKTDFLCRLAQGDLGIATEVRNRIQRGSLPVAESARAKFRTVSDLRLRADEICRTRLAAEAERREAERLRRERQEEKMRRERLDGVRRRGEDVWLEVESEIERRNASGYERAVSLISDLRTLAEEDGDTEAFSDRLDSLRLRHERKGRFIERLDELDRTR